MSRAAHIAGRAMHAAEVARWRLSKALGVPGLERFSWGFLAVTSCAIASGVMATVDAFTTTRAPDAPIYSLTWVYYLAVLIISLVVSYAMRPKPETPRPNTPQAPVAEDGKGRLEIFGTVWVDDSNQDAWRAGVAIPIRKKGGKK